jgi:AraC-like DNA-binding protein
MPVSSSVSADPLSDVLRALRLQGNLFCRSEFSAPWSVAFPAGPAFFHLVERGSCWVSAPEAGAAVELRPGDLAVLPRGRGHRLAHRRATDGVPLEDVLRIARPRRAATLRWGGGGARTHLICGTFQLDAPGRDALLSMLPPILRVAGHGGRPAEWLDVSLRFLGAEIRESAPGAELAASRIVDLIFIQTVRLWLSRQSPAPTGWLRALGDPQIGAALGRLHADVARAWTIGALAREVGMSRSRLAARFRALVGEPPIRYLARHRMRLAASLLREGRLRVHEIASRLGYESEAAFSRAFKRYNGKSPRAFQRVPPARGPAPARRSGRATLDATS